MLHAPHADNNRQLESARLCSRLECLALFATIHMQRMLCSNHDYACSKESCLSRPVSRVHTSQWITCWHGHCPNTAVMSDGTCTTKENTKRVVLCCQALLPLSLKLHVQLQLVVQQVICLAYLVCQSETALHVVHLTACA